MRRAAGRKSRSHRLIRRAETPRDYFATLDFLPFMKPLFEGYDD